MKLFITAVFLFISITVCKSNDNNSTCKVKVSLEDSLRINEMEISVIHQKLDDNQYSSEMFSIKQGEEYKLNIERTCGDFDVFYFYFAHNDWRDYVNVYVEKGIELELNFYVENNRVKLDRSKINDQNVLALLQYADLLNKTGREIWYGEFSKAEFLTRSDIYLDRTEEFLTNTNGVKDDVKAYLRFLGQANYLSDIGSIPYAYKFRFKESAPLDFDTKHNAIDVFNSPFAEFYGSAAGMIVREVQNQKELKGLTAFNLANQQIKIVKERVNNPTLQQVAIDILLEAFKKEFKGDVNFEKKIDEFKKLAQNITNKEEREKRIMEVENLKYSMPGAELPNFSMLDANGNLVNLRDLLKGQYIYFDLWASWCKPCRKEIPALKQLEKDFEDKNILFVGVSSDKKDNIWLKTLEKEGLHNTQLLDVDNKLGKSLNVTGIPRFLLYGPDGKLINSNAPRPSNPQIQQFLNRYVQ
ncbi:Peroxiredoxin [Saccharicrinis carchari]|uniref:Peroxiredoxin n=1 Tax=Saccharicrinis carchari TaxID=1168039 RepID=A0A521C6D5_SACCC|nr:TlpA disulfide reductase family protein [Saccharicrinis carchari]SMO55057.1 Peroxiredoxin [Saccharicrinis carchari]